MDYKDIKDLNLSPDETEAVVNYIKVNNQMKELERQKKKYTEQIKGIFHKNSINVPLLADGEMFTLTHTVRKTINKAKQGEFLQFLKDNNKTYLVTTSVDFDKDAILDEVNNGTLPDSVLKEYMSALRVEILNCKQAKV